MSLTGPSLSSVRLCHRQRTSGAYAPGAHSANHLHPDLRVVHENLHDGRDAHSGRPSHPHAVNGVAGVTYLSGFAGMNPSALIEQEGMHRPYSQMAGEMHDISYFNSPNKMALQSYAPPVGPARVNSNSGSCNFYQELESYTMTPVNTDVSRKAYLNALHSEYLKGR